MMACNVRGFACEASARSCPAQTKPWTPIELCAFVGQHREWIGDIAIGFAYG